MFNDMFCLFKRRWICHHSSPQLQDDFNMLVGRHGCLWMTWLFMKDWDFNSVKYLLTSNYSG